MSKKYKADEANTKKLSEIEAQKPAAYSSKDTETADYIARSILNDKGFSYTPESDASYASQKKAYQNNAEKAMNDTLGASVALSGGYANSWAQSAAQREYDRVMGEFSDIIPELYEAAYQRYRDGMDDKFDLLESYRDSDNDKYERYRDTVKDWQDARDYYYGIIRDDISDKQAADKLELDLQKVITNRLKAKNL